MENCGEVNYFLKIYYFEILRLDRTVQREACLAKEVGTNIVSEVELVHLVSCPCTQL